MGISRNKTPFLCDLAEQNNLMWVAVTETWLKPEILDSEMLVNFPNFTLLRSDRSGRSRGGVCLFLRDSLTGEVMCTFSNGVCELLVVRVRQLNTVVVVFYRPPDTTHSEFMLALSKLDECLLSLPAPTPTVTVMGDFNFPSSEVTWQWLDGALIPQVAGHRLLDPDVQTGVESGDGPMVQAQCYKMCKLMQKHHLVQTVDLITHGVETLDLVWSNNPDMISHIEATPYPQFTDHSVVKANTTYVIGDEVMKEPQFLLDSGRRLKELDMSKAPWLEIRSRLKQVDWAPMRELAKQSPTAAHSWFIDTTLLPLLEEIVPSRQRGLKHGKSRLNKSRRQIWRKLGKVRELILKTTSSTKMSKLLASKKILEIELKQSYSSTDWDQETKVVSELKSNPKSFFAYARARQQTKAKVGPFVDPITKKPNSDPNFAAEELRKQYNSVFVQQRPEWTVEDPAEFFNCDDRAWGELVDFKFIQEDIAEACGELKSSSSPGPDGLPAELLMKTRVELAEPLYILWRASLDQGVIPPDLLLVQISPLHKGGS